MGRDKERERRGLSRRSLLKTMGLGGTAVAASTLPALPVPQDGGARALGPGRVPITLNINGKAQKVELEPRVTLLDALRNHLDLTGAKKVCDRATCGACTVIMDGHAVYSCSVLAIEAQGHAITTVEGLGSPENLHPVQAAFVENDAQQCGFCTPGWVVACKAFLDKHPNPTPEQIREELGGNLCRCGTYIGIRQAVLDAAKNMKGARPNA